MSEVPLLDVRGLTKVYRRRGHSPLRALDGVDLTVERGETHAVVGESGSGKSTLALCALGLLAPTSGRVFVKGSDLLASRGRRLRELRRRVQVVFQDPFSSLNPRWDILATLLEGVSLNPRVSASERHHRVLELLLSVGLEDDALGRYPHEFSGGQRQRIAIARSLSVDPELLVLDEPVTALDVSVRARILNLFLDLQEQRGLGYLFISHDLSVVARLAHRVTVLFSGKIVERGPAESVLTRAAHPYTRALLAAVPSLIPGELPLPPGPTNHATLSPEGDFQKTPESVGCPYRNRCPEVAPVCARELPTLRLVEGDQAAACHALDPPR